MGFFITHERRPGKAKSSIRNAKAPAPRQRLQRRLATERQQIVGVQQMSDVLNAVDEAQAQLQEAQTSLRAVLTIKPLAKAFAAFQAEGGGSAADWQRWLHGLALQKDTAFGKRHLRLVVNHKPDDDVEGIEELEEFSS
jgi:hypothetical protein